MRNKLILIFFPIVIIILVVVLYYYFNGPFKINKMNDLIIETNKIYLENLKYKGNIEEFVNNNIIPSSKFIDVFKLEVSLRMLEKEGRGNVIKASEVTKKMGEIFGKGITFTHQKVAGYNYDARIQEYIKIEVASPMPTKITLKSIQKEDGTYEIFIANIFAIKTTNIDAGKFSTQVIVANDPFAESIITVEPYSDETSLTNSSTQAKKIEENIDSYIKKLTIIKYTFKNEKIEGIEYSNSL